MSADGGSPTTVLTFSDGAVPFAPSPLPDGGTILYSLARTDGPNRWNVAEIVAQEPGGAPKVLVRGGADARTSPRATSSTRPATCSTRSPSMRRDSRQAAARSRWSPGCSAAPARRPNAGTANYGLSDHGTLVYLGQVTAASTPEGGLGLADRTGAVKMLDVPKANCRSPRVSPDDRRVAVDTITDTNQHVIWVYDLSGASAMRRLTRVDPDIQPMSAAMFLQPMWGALSLSVAAEHSGADRSGRTGRRGGASGRQLDGGAPWRSSPRV